MRTPAPLVFWARASREGSTSAPWPPQLAGVQPRHSIATMTLMRDRRVAAAVATAAASVATVSVADAVGPPFTATDVSLDCYVHGAPPHPAVHSSHCGCASHDIIFQAAFQALPLRRSPLSPCRNVSTAIHVLQMIIAEADARNRRFVS